MIKESEAQKQRPHELLWMLWFDEKSIFNVGESEMLMHTGIPERYHTT